MMRILIFDDETEVLKSIEKSIRDCVTDKYSETNLEIHAFFNENELLSVLDKERFDAYFFDICSRKNEMFGIETAKKVREFDKDTHIVFITSFEGYLQTAIDELIRPSGYICKHDMELRLPRVLENIINDEKKNNSYLNAAQQYINLNDILYVCYNNASKRTEVHLVQNEVVTVSKPLVGLIKECTGSFIMINRNVAACKRNIKRCNVNYLMKSVTFADGRVFTPSRGGTQNLKEYFKIEIKAVNNMQKLEFLTQWHFWLDCFVLPFTIGRYFCIAGIFFDIRLKLNKRSVFTVLTCCFFYVVLMYAVGKTVWLLLLSVLMNLFILRVVYEDISWKERFKIIAATYMFIMMLDMAVIYAPFFTRRQDPVSVALNGAISEMIAYPLFGVLWLIKKYLLPKIKAGIKDIYLKSLLFICMAGYVLTGALMIITFVFQKPSDERVYVIMVMLLPSSLAIVFLMIVGTLYEKKLRKTLDENRRYQENIEGLYETTRIFRHDYKNAMTVLMGYAQEAGNEKIIRFLREYTDEASFKDNVYIKSVSDITDAGLKNLIISKLLESKEKGIKVVFTLEDKLDSPGIPMRFYTEIVGLLFDNAIQAGEQTGGAFIDVNLGNYTMNIINKMPEDVDPNKIFENGYTTKEGHSGIGMYRLHQIMRKYSNISYSLKTDNNIFDIKITLR